MRTVTAATDVDVLPTAFARVHALQLVGDVPVPEDDVSALAEVKFFHHTTQPEKKVSALRPNDGTGRRNEPR